MLLPCFLADAWHDYNIVDVIIISINPRIVKLAVPRLNSWLPEC